MPETELHKAARDGDKNEVESLLQDGLDVNERGAQGRSALHRALGGGHVECVRLLISKGADPNYTDSLKRTPLHWASMAPPPGNVHCCEVIFEHGDGPAMLAKTTKSGSTPLHSAAGTNRIDVVRFLVEKQSPQDVRDEDGLTAFELAKREGFGEIASMLAPSGTSSAKVTTGGDGNKDGAGCCALQ